jgi:hypothetical protein
LAFSKASSGTPFANTIGDPNSFTAGAAYYQSQGDAPGTSKQYEGVNTSYVDPKTGKTIAQYGNVGGDAYDAGSWAWYNPNQLPTGVSGGTATPQAQKDNSALVGFGLGALGLAGAAAFAPALAGASGAEAFPVADASLIPGTELGAAGAGGLTASQALTGIKGAGALASLLGGTAGSNSPSGVGSTVNETPANPNGPWNNFGNALKPTYYTYGQTPKYKGGGGVLAEHSPEFITGATGYYVKGKGTGQSDEIPAMLADGEWVFDADTVAQLGDGSSDAGAHLLDEFRKSVRAHKRSAADDKIPPKAVPIQYMREALKRAGRS